MTIEEKKRFLKQYRIQQSKIQRLEEMRKRCPERADRYRASIRECRRFRNLIEDCIDATDGDILSEILSQKYICGRTLEEISYQFNYSKRQIERLHIKALEKFCVQN